MDPNLRNFKDFLQIYNSLTEACFRGCVDSLNSRTLESKEVQCVEDCAEKFIKLNHRLMAIYIECQQIVVNKRLAEAEAQSTQAAITETTPTAHALPENKSNTFLSDTDSSLKATDISIS